MRRRYSRDDIWMNASVYFGRKRVGVLVEGTSPSWVESAANLLEKNLRVCRPHWAPLLSGWGYWLSQVAFGGLVAAIVWRVTDGLGRVLSWWGLVAAVFISLLTIGNPKFMTWLLPSVDIFTPASQVTGSAASKIAVTDAGLGELCGLDGVEADGVAQTV